RSLPFDLLVSHGRRVGVVVHGSPRSDMEFVNRSSHVPEVLRDDLAELRCELLIVGHTHRPMWFRCPEGLAINPGSVVSLPIGASLARWRDRGGWSGSPGRRRKDGHTSRTGAPWPSAGSPAASCRWHYRDRWHRPGGRCGSASGATCGSGPRSYGPLRAATCR